ncbi:MAG: heme-dependent peroxidase [Candidatus Koribacter versatilis]|uniref:Heme-dependent peroxidase n=1 Tax=Candidatus Korobacter versatilis TaxID=658062 RepID=A0A932A6J6_9BACT|nr:heme-dependent peroxidase [Candidatus Koribacter versatilis]
MATRTEVRATELPAVPLTLEGASCLHQMARVRWPEWKKLPAAERAAIAKEFSAWLAPLEAEGKTALFAMIGHKADLMLIHYRESFEGLKSAELAMANLRLCDFLEPSTSYVSVVELGLYDSTLKLYRELTEKGIEPNSAEWKAAVDETLARQAEAMKARLWPKVPPQRYVSFYPMNRLRGEDKNFYTLPIEERQRQMEAHGLVGRRYAGKVQQIITGSIGFDDWEWGVDLFSDDPLQFKKLIYEMRFDEVSAIYALFGQFFVGVRCAAAGLDELLAGKLPAKP